MNKRKKKKVEWEDGTKNLSFTEFKSYYQKKDGKGKLPTFFFFNSSQNDGQKKKRMK